MLNSKAALTLSKDEYHLSAALAAMSAGTRQLSSKLGLRLVDGNLWKLRLGAEIVRLWHLGK